MSGSDSPDQKPTEKELGEVRTAVADAAGVSYGLWLTHLLFMFYLLVAAGGVTPRG